MLDDKYRVERLIAAGGMGEVYLGTHIGLRKRVAIKVLNPQTSTAAMVERFHREAITASQIGHEGIAQVTDIGTSSDGEPFLVMEYLEGESLASRLTVSGPLAIEDACELGCAILSPLAAAHRAGIVHRDLKPDNVFLVRQSRGEMVKLLDFGISRFTGLERDFRLTATGLVLGTPYYMSPEQARGDSTVSTASDLYAFGVILYEMLIGDVPIRAENYNALMYRVTIGDFERPRERRRDVPPPLEHIILSAMAQAPADRPRARELETALLPFCRRAFRDGSGRITALGPSHRTPAPADAADSPTLTPGPEPFSGVTEPLAVAEPSAEPTAPGGPEPGPPSDGEAIAPAARPDLQGPTIAVPRSRAPRVIAAGLIVTAGALAAVVIARRITSDGTRTVMAAPERPQPATATATAGPGSRAGRAADRLRPRRPPPGGGGPGRGGQRAGADHPAPRHRTPRRRGAARRRARHRQRARGRAGRHAPSPAGQLARLRRLHRNRAVRRQQAPVDPAPPQPAAQEPGQARADRGTRAARSDLHRESVRAGGPEEMTAAYLVLLASAGLLAPAAAGAGPGGPPPRRDPHAGPRVAEPAHGEAGSATDTREADRHFRTGVALFKGAKYADALAEFERAYAIAPHPLVLYNIATCHRELSHFVEAATYYLRFLADGKASVPAAQRAVAQAELDAILPRVARVAVRIAPPSDAAVLVIDGTALDRPTSPLILSPGAHRLTARVSGRRDAERAVTVAAGDQITVELATGDPAASAVALPRPGAPSAVAARPDAGLAPPLVRFAIGAGFGTNLRLAGETGAPSLGAAVAIGARLELGLDAVMVAYAIIPAIRVRIAGDDLALHAIGAVPYSLTSGSMSERFAAPAIGLGLRYRPTPNLAVRLEGYAAFAGRGHGTAIPMFLGAERWF
jgi:serine/threonine protein kinase